MTHVAVTAAGLRGVGHSDRPIDRLDQDSLGLDPYARGLAEFIRHCDTPFTVAVQGDWGTGKTSLMRMVDGLLTPETATGAKPIKAVWFQTWQYSQFGSMAALPVSLLATLLECLSPPTKLQAAKQVMGRLIKPLANAAIRAGSLGASELDDFEGLVARQSIDSASNADALKREIAGVIQQQLDDGADRIVIFIDDLDRIKPAIAVEILETIKLFVDWPGCVFVLALDYAVVSRGLSEKFGMDEHDLGRSFFDKIIQLPFTVPVGRYTIDKYMATLFRDMRLPMRDEDSELFAELVRWSVSVNPRSIKRVFNSLQLLIAMANARQDRLAIRILFAVLCLQMHYPSVYGWLLDRAERLDDVDLLALRAADDEDQDAALRQALRAIPEKRRTDFPRFADRFLVAVQNPDQVDTAIDAAELDRVRQVLTLSRVTSIKVADAVPGPPNDPDFRARNRQLIASVREAWATQLREEIDRSGRDFWINTAHSMSNVYLKRGITPDGSMNLVLNHGEDEVLLYIEGGKRALRTHAAVLKAVLEPVASTFEDHGDEGLRFFRKELPIKATIAEREALLLGEVQTVYLQASEALWARLAR